MIPKAVAREAKSRFETADEFLHALERGSARPLPAPRPTPLAERDPLTLWRTIAIVSIVLSILLLYRLLAQ